MERLSFITCAACVLFLSGKCLCFTQTGGPRFTGSCHSCKCVVVWYLTNKKKQSRKTLFHVNSDRMCDCKSPCLFGERCLTTQGKLAFHPNCRKLWKQCEHMQKISVQLEEYSEAVGEGVPLVPDGCIPLIGYAKKKSTLLEIPFAGRNFLEERQLALKTYKKNHNLKWNYQKQRGKKLKAAPPTSGREKAVQKTWQSNAKEDTEKPLTMSEYFLFVKKVVNGIEQEVFYSYKNISGEMQICTYGMLQNFLETEDLSFPVVELFFSLLCSRVKNCSAVSPAFLQQKLFATGDSGCLSTPKAAKLVTKEHEESLNSAEIIFLPFFEEQAGYWNLIVLSCSMNKGREDSEQKVHCLYFFNGAAPKDKDSRIRGRNRDHLRRAQKFLAIVLKRRLKPIRLKRIAKPQQCRPNKYDIFNIAKQWTSKEMFISECEHASKIRVFVDICKFN